MNILPLNNILLFLSFFHQHWDWFENLESKRGAVERAKMHAARALLGRDRSSMQRSVSCSLHYTLLMLSHYFLINTPRKRFMDSHSKPTSCELPWCNTSKYTLTSSSLTIFNVRIAFPVQSLFLCLCWPIWMLLDRNIKWCSWLPRL